MLCDKPYHDFYPRTEEHLWLTSGLCGKERSAKKSMPATWSCVKKEIKSKRQSTCEK